jgi:cytidine deaminase
MKKIDHHFTIEEYQLQELNQEEQSLIQKAKDATALSHSPYSRFRVGCAILLENGETVLGANQENAAYPVCLCAEGVALANAAANFNKVSIVSMAITIATEHGKMLDPVAPCGLCRQSILEYENRQNKNISLYLKGEGEKIYKVQSIKDLLPLNFSDKALL